MGATALTKLSSKPVITVDTFRINVLVDGSVSFYASVDSAAINMFCQRRTEGRTANVKHSLLATGDKYAVFYQLQYCNIVKISFTVMCALSQGPGPKTHFTRP